MSSDMSVVPRKLWEHLNPKSTLSWKFMETANRKHGLSMSSWDELHSWSINQRSQFWDLLFKEHPIIHEGGYSRVVDESARMDSIPPWFVGVKVNFAENILYWPDAIDPSKATTHRKEDHRIAAIQVREGCTEIEHFTWKQLREQVGVLSNALRARGVKEGDRIGLVASNSFDTLTVFLATTALGGIFSSSSTDMGTRGILDRLRQIKPKYIFVDDGAVYNGKTVDLREKMREIQRGMEDISELKGLISMSRWIGKPEDISSIPECETFANLLQAGQGDKTIRFKRIDFNAPVIIVYSSGTTGMPKCIVHAGGPVIINAKKEFDLHRDAASYSPDNLCQLQYTTTGWIMYLASMLGLVAGSKLVLYDGSPFQPDLKTFVKLWGDLKVTDLGLSPRYFQTLASAKPPVSPRQVTDLSNLRRCYCTGMVLADVQFEWFYDKGFPAHVQLENISGGTDVGACFTLGTLMKPLYVGGCMTAGLGMKIEVYDQTVEGGRGVKGKALPLGEPGELVCSLGFPTQPVKFWDDPSGERYFKSYFERFDDVWTHGDFIAIHPKTRQVFFYGRADGVLNPSGIRFGSAEIYNVIDNNFSDEVQDSICVGQRRPNDLDETVMLFVLMKPGKKFTPDLVKRIKGVIGRDLGKRYVPFYIFETPEIPTTINLKKVELPVKQIVSGTTIKPSDTLANKESLDYYYQFAKVEDLVRTQSKL